MRVYKYIVGLCGLLVAACSNPVGTGENEPSTTPMFTENRIFGTWDYNFLLQGDTRKVLSPKEKEKEGICKPFGTITCIDNYPANTSELVPLSIVAADSKYWIEHNRPVSLFLQHVHLPDSRGVQYNGWPPRRGLLDAPWSCLLCEPTLDVAIIIDLAIGDEPPTSVVAFYQREVRSGGRLNLENLLIYAKDAWDSGKPPRLRVRVMDVSAEKNQEARRGLATVERVGNVLAGAIGNPIAGSFAELALNTARIIVDNQQNRPIIDFTVQFTPAFSASTSAIAPSNPQTSQSTTVSSQANSPWLTPLIENRMVVLGANKDFWDRQAPNKPLLIRSDDLHIGSMKSRKIFEEISKDQENQIKLKNLLDGPMQPAGATADENSIVAEPDIPVVMLKIVAQQLVVGKSVKDAQRAMLDRINAAASEGAGSVEQAIQQLTTGGPLLARIEAFNKSRDRQTLQAILEQMNKMDDAQQKSAGQAWGAAAATILNATGCNINGKKSASDLLGTVKNLSTEVKVDNRTRSLSPIQPNLCPKATD